MQPDKTATRPLLGAVFMGVVVLDSILDFGGIRATYRDMGVSPWTGWAIAVAATAVVYGFVEATMLKQSTHSTESTAEIIDVSSIDSSILNRWDVVWDEFEIDPDEPRAEITQFPDVLWLIQELETARRSCSVRSTRVSLGNQVMTLMRETLGPLAETLRYEQSQLELDQTERREQAAGCQAAADARAAMLANMPI